MKKLDSTFRISLVIWIAVIFLNIFSLVDNIVNQGIRIFTNPVFYIELALVLLCIFLFICIIRGLKTLFLILFLVVEVLEYYSLFPLAFSFFPILINSLKALEPLAIASNIITITFSYSIIIYIIVYALTLVLYLIKLPIRNIIGKITSIIGLVILLLDVASVICGYIALGSEVIFINLFVDLLGAVLFNLILILLPSAMR